MRSVLIILVACVQFLLAGKSCAATLRTVAEARRLDDDSCRRVVPFDFTGTLLYGEGYAWFFRDPTGGIEMLNRLETNIHLQRGARLRVQGELRIETNGARKFLAKTVEQLGQEPLDPPVEAQAAEILNGLMDFRRVRIRGVLSAIVPDEIDTADCWATLRTPSGKISVVFLGKWNDVDALNRLIDAEVVLTGFSAPITGLRRNLGRCLRLADDDTIEILAPPPADPFSAPSLSDEFLPHRQRAHGVVLAVESQRFFIQTNARRLISVLPLSGTQNPHPLAGDTVSVVGFATGDPYRTQLTGALVRIDERGDSPRQKPTPRTIQSLFIDENGSAKIDSTADGTFISVQGTVQAISPYERTISDGRYVLSIDVATLQRLGIPIPDEKSTVAVSGLCLAEFENPSTPAIYPTFKRFTLVPRTANDLVVLATPPWWTPIRLTMLIIILATILLGSALWNFTLKNKSEKRGKQLYEEKIEHALAEQKVEERTHLAVELHDSVSQTLTGVALQLDGGAVETAKTMLASCREELRRCLWDLRSRTFEEKDLTEAVTRTLAPHLHGCEASIRFNVPREQLSESLTHAILRIIRELVINAIRHGKARHVKIAGETHANTVSFSVRDDGCGFDPDRAPDPEEGHFGLLGIRERIEEFDGSINIDSSPGQGTRFTITLTTTGATDE